MTEMETDETRVKQRKESEAQRKRRLDAAISDVLASSSGRIVLKEILGLCQVESLNGLDGVAAGRVEGARSVGLLTIRMLREADPQGWLKLYGEIHE